MVGERSGSDVELARAVLLMREGLRAEALTLLRELAFDPPLDVAAWLLEARLLGHADAERSWEIYTRALARHPRHAALNLRAGVFAYERGDLERARTLLEHSWSLAPSAEAGVYLGRIHAARAEHARSRAFYAQAAAFETEGGHWCLTAERELVALGTAPGGS